MAVSGTAFSHRGDYMNHGGVSPVIYRIMIDEGTEIVCFPQ
jgi:hypothetical protein